ncbi:MAG TPA: threonine--tRNA ligase [Candidatus Micrarchaeota archaeon]|nr:threonine--tRNA ligase [Candidatus Micrarchaeota archaeon]
MKLLLVHADFIEYEPLTKAFKAAADVPKGKTRVEECLVAFMAVEKDDVDAQIVSEKALAEIVKTARLVKAARIVLYPWVHLTQEPSPLDVAQKTLAAISEQAKKYPEFEFHSSPFGWYKSFDVKCKGHPLSELSRKITAEPQGKASKPPAEKMFAKYCSSLPNATGAEIARKTAALLAMHAASILFPKAKFGTISITADGFAADIDVGRALTPADLDRLSAKMSEISKSALAVASQQVPKAKAIEAFAASGQAYFLDALSEAESSSVYLAQAGGSSYLAEGPFASDFSKCPHFKLTKVGGAYWRNDSTKAQMQRISGFAFQAAQELEAHLKLVEEAEKRDHRKIGVQLGLLMFHDWSPGSPFLLPNGTVVYNELQQFIREEYFRRGYSEVITPQLFNKKLWEASGHWQHYKDNMFLLNVDGEEFSLKPMNCPSHVLLFKSQFRSYRELPFRVADFGMLHRNELKGVLGGMTRVRKFSQDDAHIFCTEEQIESEINGVLEFVKHVYGEVFGFEFTAKLSTRPESFMGDVEIWNRAEASLEAALKKNNFNYTINAADGAFYGPKIDFDVKDALGRSWQLATVQLDFQMPLRMGAKYEGPDGKQHTAVMIHRAVLGSLERFMGILIEHYAGAFPLWLAPVQAIVVPLSLDQNAPAAKMAGELKAQGIRAEADLSDGKMEGKVKDAYGRKIPNIIVVGRKEVEAGTVSVRKRGNVQLRDVPFADFSKSMLEEIRQKKSA